MIYECLTANENFVLTHTSMFGLDSYPLRKRGRRWWVDGIRGCGACPSGFKTKREAAAQWEAYLEVLRERVGEFRYQEALKEQALRTS